MTTALVLQARLDSSRLPGKALLPLNGKPFIVRVMDALKHVPAHMHILACPRDCEAEFASLARDCGFELYTGPKEDVLERYCGVIRKYGVDRVIRATGDNPFVFTAAAAAINAEALALSADYAAYAGLPLGAGVESVQSSALLKAGIEASSPYDREHVCPYLYGHPEQFLLHRPLAPVRWQAPSVRLTVDTENDYRQAEVLYAALDKNCPGAERCLGPEILKTYRELFPELTQ